MLSKVMLLGLIQLFLLTGVASAQPVDNRIEIDGLILNQTKTRTGHNFYRQFAALWEAPGGADGFNIVVIEIATPQWGSIIQIKVNDTAVFLNLLKPSDTAVSELAKNAVERVREYITTYVRDLEKYKDDDLAKDGW